MASWYTICYCQTFIIDLTSQRGTFLIDIGAQINKQKDDKDKHVLSVVEDKVVQDIDGTEGTGVSS